MLTSLKVFLESGNQLKTDHSWPNVCRLVQKVKLHVGEIRGLGFSGYFVSLDANGSRLNSHFDKLIF